MFSIFSRWLRSAVVPLCCSGLLLFVPAARAGAAPLPPEVMAALGRAGLSPRSLVAVVAPAEASAAAVRLSHRGEVPVNPASVMKLVTTFAGLELLGPAFTWRTGVYLDGALRGGTLQGDLVLQGGGDPKLVAERLWLLLRRVRGLGVQHVAGDIVLDRGAFERSATDPAAFDNEPLRPYNATPDALLVNFKSVALEFTPDIANRVARIAHEPPLAGLELPRSVPLGADDDCGDWRAKLRADFTSDPVRARFDGAYPAACGDRSWTVAPLEPDRFAARAVAGMWREVGGTLAGSVRDGRAPARVAPTFVLESPPLAEIVRDINKFSNNLMAQQLFLTLSLQDTGLGSRAGSAAVLSRWWSQRFGAGSTAPRVDNGAGLSRDARITADALARLLQAAFASPLMPEFIASLPIQGIDGTLRKRRDGGAPGYAHLKSGSLRDVAALAGYVDGASGQRWVLVAIVNDANAAAARGVLDALVDWTRNDLAPAVAGPGRR